MRRGGFWEIVGSEEARLRAGLRPPLKQHGRFSRISFHDEALLRDASDGTN